MPAEALQWLLILALALLAVPRRLLLRLPDPVSGLILKLKDRPTAPRPGSSAWDAAVRSAVVFPVSPPGPAGKLRVVLARLRARLSRAEGKLEDLDAHVFTHGGLEEEGEDPLRASVGDLEDRVVRLEEALPEAGDPTTAGRILTKLNEIEDATRKLEDRIRERAAEAATLERRRAVSRPVGYEYLKSGAEPIPGRRVVLCYAESGGPVPWPSDYVAWRAAAREAGLRGAQVSAWNAYEAEVALVVDADAGGDAGLPDSFRDPDGRTWILDPRLTRAALKASGISGPMDFGFGDSVGDE